MNRVAAEIIRTWLTEGEELAVLDVREHGQFGEGHVLHAVNVPYSRLELVVAELVPRAGARIVLMDDGDGVTKKAAGRLDAMGYSNVSVLDGDLASCEAAGFTMFKGEGVPSKTLGELAEEIGNLPSLTPAEMTSLIESGDDYILLDGRTPREFNNMSIPTGRSCPNAEMGYRLPLFVSDPDTKVVINCAGRTRSLVGAQSLRNLGFENPIYALENGTQGWTLAGFELARGQTPAPLPDVTGDHYTAAKSRAAEFMSENNIPFVDAKTLADWTSDETRTLYLFDVRTDEEFAAGHLAGAIHAPGGQLVQGTDHWVAVRGARIVLCDDGDIRAANSAYWLRAMGHDVNVLSDDVSDAAPALPASNPEISLSTETLGTITPADLNTMGPVPVIVDLRPSAAYRDAHVEGALWSIRPTLGSLDLAAGVSIVLTAEDKMIAELAALDLRDAGAGTLHYLDGGPDDWRIGGLTITATPDTPPDAERIDYLFFVHDRHFGNLEASQGYLNWELGLIGQLKDWERDLFPILDGHSA